MPTNPHGPARTLLFAAVLIGCVDLGAQSKPMPERLFAAIGLRPGSTACEVGAGDGTLSMAAARIVGPAGRVLANEFGDDHVTRLRDRLAAAGIAQATVIAGSETATNFPAGTCDAVFMNDVYHHFSHPAEMNASIFASLTPGGRIGVVDFTPPGAEAPRPAERGNDGMHGITSATLVRELTQAGFDAVWSESVNRVVFVVMRKPGGPP